MSASDLRQAFRRRFRGVARQIWSLHVARGVARTVVVAAAVAALAAAADYIFELSWWARAAIAAAALAALTAAAAAWIVRPARAWTRTRVASELEELFPRLGQRVRTASQHGARSVDELARDGVSPGMTAALEAETAEKARPLPFQAALPVRPAVAAGLLAAIAVAALAVTAAWAPEWRTAFGRIALASTTYSNLTATPSADVVDEGTDVQIVATLSGRARPSVVLHTRDAGDPLWREETMDAGDDGYLARLPGLQTTTEFFVSAGPEQTPVRQIVVRHALKLLGIRSEVAAPAYTGVPLANYEGGSFSAVQGSTAALRFEFDRAPVAAALVVKDPTKRTEPRRLEMKVEGRKVSVELLLAADLEYSVEARDSDGMPLVPNRQRIRVTADQPPAVWFESPAEAMEVHTLAEVVMRVRARDDFGLTRVGIVFQVNNEEERSLVLLDVSQANQREAVVEQILMLEQYLLTQKDCVAYYAFAEDNRPDAPQRTVTELRFIDIRPFLRIYRLIDPPENAMPGQQRDLIFLDEVIARQRFNLNQTMRLEARSKVALDVAQLDKIAAFENQLANQTHNLADFLAGLGVDGAAILTQAEEAMLSAVDSLNAGKFATAINQERDALRFLMEARNTVQLALSKKPRAVRAQARTFDRLQRQKLRRPKEEAETLAQIAEQLGKLADDEDDVARMIAAQAPGEGAGADPMGKPMPGAGADPMGKPMPGAGADPMGKPMPGASKGDPKARKGEDPAQERQDEIAGQAAAIEMVARTAKGLTALARTRIGEAAKAANAGADALGQGDRAAARKEVDRARELFRTAGKQVAALAAEEAAQQLAMARDLANDIAQQAAPPDPKAKGAGGGKGDMKMPGGVGEKGDKTSDKTDKTGNKTGNKTGKDDTKKGLGGAAEQAKSLQDVLENLAGSTAEGDADAARKAGAILKQEDLAAAIGRLEKPGAGDDPAERQDLADRFAALGQKLDQAYRDAIAPRLEEIARLERDANELEKRAAAADDPTEWRRLKQQGAGFADRLEAAGLDSLISEDLRAGLKGGDSGAGIDQFRRGIQTTHARLLAKLQEFLAGDRLASGNEAVPPEYKDLVERYLRALSAGGSK